MSLILEAKGLECVRGGRRLFHDLSFSLQKGELIEVTGANGSGKTSLLRILCTLLSPTAGDILWQDAPIASLKEEYLDSLIYVAHANGVKARLRTCAYTAGSRATGETMTKSIRRFDVSASADANRRRRRLCLRGNNGASRYRDC